jgi:hypothetical protein
MPAEGAMQIEAPATEPRTVADPGVALRGVSKRHRSRRGEVQALDDLSVRARVGLLEPGCDL